MASPCAGCLELNEQTVEVLLTTASLLQLEQIQAACCQFLERQLHPSNCIGIGLFADRQGCADLYRSVQQYTAVSDAQSGQHSILSLMII